MLHYFVRPLAVSAVRMAVLQPLRQPLMEGPLLIEATAQRPCRTRHEFGMTRFVSYRQVVLGLAASAGRREVVMFSIAWVQIPQTRPCAYTHSKASLIHLHASDVYVAV